MKSWLKIILGYLFLAAFFGIISWLLYRGGYHKTAFVVAIVPLAMIVNGWFAEWEDRQPGGFLNPTEREGKDKKK